MIARTITGQVLSGSTAAALTSGPLAMRNANGTGRLGGRGRGDFERGNFSWETNRVFENSRIAMMNMGTFANHRIILVWINTY